MNEYMYSTAKVVDATVATIEVLKEVCGIHLSEAMLDRLLCSAYREYVGVGAVAVEPGP